jgi:hypothetical protein
MTVWHPRGPESSAVLLWEHHILQDAFSVESSDVIKVPEKELLVCKFNSADDSACCIMKFQFRPVILQQ